MNFRTLLALLLMTGLLASGAGLAAQETSRPLVVATTTQARDALELLAGERIELIGLMGAGVDPHLYRPHRGQHQRHASRRRRLLQRPASGRSAG